MHIQHTELLRTASLSYTRLNIIKLIAWHHDNYVL